MPDGPVGPPAKWAATSNVEVGQMTYPVNRGRVDKEGKKGMREKVAKGGEGMRKCRGLPSS